MPCYHPISIRSPLKENVFIDVPCGKCAGCRRSLQDDWYIRFREEEKVSDWVRFVTLTYDDLNCPFGVFDNGEDFFIHLDLKKDHLQKFLKRCRKTNKFKYFAVGEYGSDSKRPHYHILIFGKQSKMIDYAKYWKYGFVDDCPADPGSFRYVTKYLLKGSKVPPGSPPTFSIMSKRPAIGIDFLNKINISMYDDGYENYFYRLGPTKKKLPRFFRKKLRDLGVITEESTQLTIETMQGNVFKPAYNQYKKNHKDSNFESYLLLKEQNDLKIQKEINNGQSCKI